MSIGVGSLVVALGSIGGFGTHTSITLFFPTLNIVNDTLGFVFDSVSDPFQYDRDLT